MRTVAPLDANAGFCSWGASDSLFRQKFILRRQKASRNGSVPQSRPQFSLAAFFRNPLPLIS